MPPVAAEPARIRRDLLVIHRLEQPLPIMFLCYAGWGSCFAVGDARKLLGGPVLLAVAANLLLILAALALNAAVDTRTDEHDTNKSHLACAALRVGRGRTLRWAATEAATALAAAAAAALWIGRWTLAGIAAATIGLHLLYNVEPVRLKRRGFAGSAALGASLVALPFLLAYGAARAGFEASMWPILTGLTVLATGRAALWSVPDRAADRATGITTPAVRYGARRTLALSCLIMLAGLGLLSWGLWERYGPGWVVPGTAAHIAFLATAFAPLIRTSDQAASRVADIRRPGMTLVTIGEIVLGALPLIA
jgi:lycopene elongase/hydratase (dihydrobisanhydrobacterioruberin-forming)